MVEGGTIVVPSTANQRDNGHDNSSVGLYVDGASGTVHIEGITIRSQANTMFDGIDINAPAAAVQIEEVRIKGVYGSFDAHHADAVQVWGGVRALRIDHLSLDGDYQGINLAPDLGAIGRVNIRNVDMTVDRTPQSLAAHAAREPHMLWLTRGALSCEAPASVRLKNVYLSSRLAGTYPIGDLVWPQVGHTSLSCHATQVGRQISWPSLRVSGSVTAGPPPSGTFVPRGASGYRYRRP